jgi:drug/metabolite transporter (DMT)-like permease
VSQSSARPDGKAGAPRLSLTAVLATLCYGVVPVLKKFGTDHGGPPVLGALVMHATGLTLLMTLGNLLKIERKWQRIPTASLICFVLAGFLYAIGSIFTLKALVHAPASVVAPIWSAQPIVSFFLAKTTLKGIEEVTFKDGAAAALVVIGVLVLRWG